MMYYIILYKRYCIRHILITAFFICMRIKLYNLLCIPKCCYRHQ